MKCEVNVIGSEVVGCCTTYELATPELNACQGDDNKRNRTALKTGRATSVYLSEVNSGLLASHHGRSKLNMDCKARAQWV